MCNSDLHPKKNDGREEGLVILWCMGIHVYSREDENVRKKEKERES
jgi:hypothetical protein